MNTLTVFKIFGMLLIPFFGFVFAGKAMAQQAMSQPEAAALGEDYSFTPSKPCTPSPKAPPKSILHKKYQAYFLTFNVYQLDINGDGICDWLREGFEASRHDNFEAIWQDNYLFLGTPRGWRRSKPIDWVAFSKNQPWEISPPQAPLVALILYRKNQTIPYIIFFDGSEILYSESTRLPSVASWDVKHEQLLLVDESIRMPIISYLAKTFCDKGIDPDQVAKEFKWTYFRALIAPSYSPSTLCRRVE